MLRALDETHIGGIKNNMAFFRDIIRDPEFAAGDIHTGFIAEYLGSASGCTRRPGRRTSPYPRGDRRSPQNENGGHFRGRRILVLNGCVKDAHAFCVRYSTSRGAV